MSNDNAKYTEELASIIRLLADVWPNDRENVAIAGAKFEEVIDTLNLKSGQIQRLIDTSWEGIKHLYQKDEYFLTVKSCTMGAVNILREYILNDGDIKVEDFEKPLEELEKALAGVGESVDSVIELSDVDSEVVYKAEDTAEDKEYKIDDLSSLIITVDEISINDEQIELLKDIVIYLYENGNPIYKNSLDKIKTVIKDADTNAEDGWLEKISILIEDAINAESNADWNASTTQNENKNEVVELAVSQEVPLQEETLDEVNKEDELFTIPIDIELSMVGEFITECKELIEMAESALLDLEEAPDDNELINTVFRAFHTIKGTSAFMGLDPIAEFTHSVETLLSMVREGDLKFDRACADITLESIDIINQLLSIVEHSKGGDNLPTSEKYSKMMRVLGHVSDDKMSPFDSLAEEMEGDLDVLFEEHEELEEGALEQVEDKIENAEKITKSESESSVRVSVSRLDRLIDMVGELVIAHSVVAQDEQIPKDSDLQKKVNHATKILRELQDTSLTLRMVPLKATFHKMNRLVRDLSRKAGKKIKFSTFGEDTEIDRNMVDVINEPLIHMLRNSLDHGIEHSEERLNTKKDKIATITLRASQEGGKVVIEIEDDGRGIDKDVIYAKAVEKGIIEPDKKLSESEIYGLIFLPGFSSAEKVTDLSGRGVGMDVVRRSIEQLQGKVEVNSEKGKGTRIKIELPFTLAITDGMLVRVGTERFIVPTINIDLTFRAEENDVFTVLGNSEQVSFRGKSVPVMRLHRIFQIKGATENLLEGTLLVIKNNNSRYALLVDEVIGQQQLVGKSINMIGKTDHISGGAILGDGRVGLILDTAALLN